MQPAHSAASDASTHSAERVFRSNYLYHIGNGLCAGFGDALVDTRLIVTAFLSQLTTSNVLIGLIAPLRDTGWFLPQIFVSPMVERAPRKIDVYRAVTVVRAATWVLLVAAMFLVTAPGWLLAVFFLCTLLLSIFSGIAGLPFMMVTTKVIPATRRSTLFAVRQTLGGLLGVLAGGAVALILGGGLGLEYPKNYALLFAAAAALNILGNWLFGRIKEQPDSLGQRESHLRLEFSRVWGITRKDRDFSRYIVARSAIVVGGASVPFLTVFASRELGIQGAGLGTLLSITLASSLIANMVWGRLADRRGNRITLLAGAMLGLVFTAIAVLQTGGALSNSVLDASLVLAIAFIVSGVMASAVNVSGSPLIMELAPAEWRSVYFGLTNSLLGVVMIATSLVGLIVDRLGFAGLYAFAMAAYVVALVALYFMREPRTR